MASSKQIKQLILSFDNKDQTLFYDTVMQIVNAEIRKGHVLAANDILQALRQIDIQEQHDSG